MNSSIVACLRNKSIGVPFPACPFPAVHAIISVSGVKDKMSVSYPPISFASSRTTVACRGCLLDRGCYARSSARPSRPPADRPMDNFVGFLRDFQGNGPRGAEGRIHRAGRQHLCQTSTGDPEEAESGREARATPEAKGRAEEDIMLARESTLPLPHILTGRQRHFRRRSRVLPLKRAVHSPPTFSSVSAPDRGARPFGRRPSKFGWGLRHSLTGLRTSRSTFPQPLPPPPPPPPAKTTTIKISSATPSGSNCSPIGRTGLPRCRALNSRVGCLCPDRFRRHLLTPAPRSFRPTCGIPTLIPTSEYLLHPSAHGDTIFVGA